MRNKRTSHTEKPSFTKDSEPVEQSMFQSNAPIEDNQSEQFPYGISLQGMNTDVLDESASQEIPNLQVPPRRCQISKLLCC